MKPYPSIPTKPTGNCSAYWVFDKLDGSNVRAEWSKKKGFSKFGSRKRLLGTDQGILSKAQSLIEQQETSFRDVFSYHRIDKVTCFFEFWGPKSFAGSHLIDDEHQVSLLDIDVYKKGLISPAQFLDMFEQSSIAIPKFLHHGSIDERFKQDVREGRLSGVTYEGVVCKAYSRKKRTVDMFKIKSNAWIKAVKTAYQNNPKLLEQLI